MSEIAPKHFAGSIGPRDTRWITATVAMFAIIVFAFSASQILPSIFAGSARRVAIDPQLTTAFLLNIALLLLAWRRSNQLRQSFEERDAAEKLFRELAYFDEVTGLFNRRYLREAIDSIRTLKDQASALLLLDLDQFKKVNDLYGHEIGDQLLNVIASRIRAMCGEHEICVRLGGDEFAILLWGPSAVKGKPAELATKLIAELNRPIKLATTSTVIGASIGISAYDRDSEKLSWLLKSADIAMYEAKRRGRNRWVEFDASMETELIRRNLLESEIRQGIAKQEFVPYFQPIIDLETSEARGFEVLARWRHPSRGLLEPADFFEIASSSGLISDLSLGVMEKALSVAVKWPAQYKIAVNVSPVQFKDPLLAQRILQILRTTGFPAERLELEVMEASLLHDHDYAMSIIRSLKDFGISISVDDLGAGYISLTKLKNLPFDRIKIDRAFVETLDDDETSDALVRAISTLGEGLCVPISAEGVECKAIREKLIELGCVDAQGWLFGRALSAEEADLGLGDWFNDMQAGPANKHVRQAIGG